MKEDMNSPMDMGQWAELPQYGIAVNEQGQLWLTIGYGTAAMQFYLADTTNYEEVARKLHKNIMDAGVAGRRAKSRLVEAKGIPDATLRNPPGGKPGR